MSHYFTTPEGPENRRLIRATIFDEEFEFETANGVFSRDGLDLATGVLLRSVTPSGRRLLDLGCGWGPIAVALARACPDAVVDAVDPNERALQLCRDNAARNGVAERVRTLHPDRATDERYDEIWSNPPIRIGKQALHELLTHWLGRLTDEGRAHLVVGKNLGADSLQKWLVGQGWHCERVASAKGFRVFTITR